MDIVNISEFTYNTIRVRRQRQILTLQLFRPEANNSITSLLVEEMMMALLQCESDPEVKVVILEGLPDNFCTGMDFKVVSERGSAAMISEDPHWYFEMLKHFSTCSKIIVSKVEGRVNAGGIGLVAASDIVIASEKATFGLSEALFGLLPACVLPFLMRRVGYQKALWMTLTTQAISAVRAHEIGLVDEYNVNLEDAVRRNVLRLIKLDLETIKDLKGYMSNLLPINDQVQRLAVDKITSLVNSQKVQFNIRNFIQDGKFPWDK